jgi:hypothetical protein
MPQCTPMQHNNKGKKIMNLDPHLSSYTKIKLLKENIKVNLHDFGFGKGFFY